MSQNAKHSPHTYIRTIQSHLVIESRANGTYIFFLLVLLLFLCPYILPDFEKSQRRAHSACTTFSRNELTLKLFVLGVVERIERVWSTSNFFAFELEKRSTEKKYSLTYLRRNEHYQTCHFTQ